MLLLLLRRRLPECYYYASYSGHGQCDGYAQYCRGWHGSVVDDYTDGIGAEIVVTMIVHGAEPRSVVHVCRRSRARGMRVVRACVSVVWAQTHGPVAM